jgi:hypothetical protein
LQEQGRNKRDDGYDGLNDAGALAKQCRNSISEKMFSHQLVMDFGGK